MDYITKETLNKYVKGKSVIELKDFLEIFEKEFGIAVLSKDNLDYEKLSEEQKKKMTKEIFLNKDVMEQLQKASTNRDYVEKEEEAIQIIREARNEQ